MGTHRGDVAGTPHDGDEICVRHTAEHPPHERPKSKGWASAGAVFVLLVTLVIGVSSQGAFYYAGRLQLAFGLGLAVLLTFPSYRCSLAALRRAPSLTALVLSGGILLISAAHGSIRQGLPAAGLAAGIAAVFVTIRCLTPTDREMLTSCLMWLGGLVALTSWLGVVLHLHRWAWEGQGLWRASGSITYPNATAAILVPLALWAIARTPQLSEQAQGPPTGSLGPSWSAPALATFMLTAAAATLSRGGTLALAVGIITLILLAAPGIRSAIFPVVFGTGVAFIGLVPSMASGQEAHPVSAVIGLVAGILIGVRADPNERSRQRRLLTRTTAPLRRAVQGRSCGFRLVGFVGSRRWLGWVRGSGLLIFLFTGAVALSDGFGGAVRKIVDERVLSGPSYRWESAQAAMERIAGSPWTGDGPGQGQITWTTAGGENRTLMFLHDEYLQVAMELGLLIGFLLLLHLTCCAFVLVRTNSPAPSLPVACRRIRAGGAAAFMAFVAHSAVDFTWHLPALPLVVVALAASALYTCEEAEQGVKPQEYRSDDVDVREDVTDVRNCPAKKNNSSSITHS